MRNKPTKVPVKIASNLRQTGKINATVGLPE
jgi:hypothetical protein